MIIAFILQPGRNSTRQSLSDSNDTTSDASTSVSGGLAEFVATLAKVVGVSMNHHGTSNDIMFAAQGQQFVLKLHFGNTAIISSDVSQISGMTLFVIGASVGLVVWVEMRSSGHASVSGITELMNVEAVIARGESGDFAANVEGGSGTRLTKPDNTLDIPVSLQNCNSVDRHGLPFAFFDNNVKL